MRERNSHCGFCGTRFVDGAGWPRTCAACGNITYLNPVPVAVMVLPVGDGVLCVRRNIAPKVGELALPGGYMGLGESWQDAAARELFEETGVRVDGKSVRDLLTRSTPDGRQLIVFGVGPDIRPRDLPAFVPNEETQEMVVIDAPRELAFTTHTEALALYWSRFRKPHGGAA